MDIEYMRDEKKEVSGSRLSRLLLCLALLAAVVCLTELLRDGDYRSGRYMVKSRVEQVMTGVSQHVLTFFQPGVFTKTAGEGSWQRILLETVDRVIYIRKDFEKEYKSAAETIAVTQKVPENYYDTSEQFLLNSTEEMTAATETTQEERKEKQKKQTIKKHHTYSKKYTDRQLNSFSFLTSHIYSIDSMTPVKAKDIRAKTLLKRDLSIEKNKEQPQILIYHTHASEAFANSRKGKKEDTVVGAGRVLAKQLEAAGYGVYHDETVYDVINGKLDRSLAYNEAEKGITRILQQNPSIEVVIDLHRDGVADSTRIVTMIDGKPTAKIMLFNGMSRIKGKGEISYLANPHRSGNLAFSLQLQMAAEDRYDDFVRKIFVRSYRYNLHHKDRSLLVEAGAQTNTVEEIKNAMIPLSEMLDAVLGGK